MQSMWIEPILALIFGYLLGSIPFGLLLTQLSGAGDLRAIGSGNIGATNVLRTGNKGIAALTLILDIAKGAVAVILAGLLSEGLGVLAGLGAFLGHLYPVWLRFNGGKGVATLLGVVTALSPLAGLVFAVTWLGSLAIWRYSSVGGMLAAVSVPVTAVVIGKIAWVPMFIGFALLVCWKHRGNIERLMAGEEPKVGAS
ncbi:glycerol-3-phosphate 1-O-acyltransferase PlsY [Parasphingorhabdus halotolerans]|uniref:Glycerol-3-phosphate acyltransferase n=1 Tax=Parasphingorhabdus halotolerans TaxID=2725558 RepID=A0A6H2DK23_9SPHN|nr:glycerol-3-phosphate 1-O-acyltransferase PlsY [Parasphingorhabdus halotolerans]QJB68295.1 glycerol-3-phosphate 1-O-acyltransferase PlsY [Parasphingorhabdus halotolerans]